MRPLSPRSLFVSATALMLGVAGTALSTAAAQPAAGPAGARALYAPSALVLTVGPGETRAGTTAERAVTLSCAPRATGTHPAAADACRELRSVGGDFRALPSELPQTLCTREWAPVTVTADGVWDGRRVGWSGTYNNSCEMAATLGVVFDF
ncbi:subtilase-type protease inhibitor [Streptomyces qinzhouensis]|uniref:Probable subtilase-type protease inhibitor n=1 Tax=Streptomyces qinzhouensis TaxID=2599401 RepID=A0A5B8JBY2_9ACTN|nr:subtilase-type protease inhibitor [Streptomyces qinzhouensis]QDY77401.1 serine protease [Streptomyces qinzhouensis]